MSKMSKTRKFEVISSMNKAYNKKISMYGSMTFLHYFKWDLRNSGTAIFALAFKLNGLVHAKCAIHWI